MDTATGTITVRLLLFAQFREALGEREREFALPPGATPRDALRLVADGSPRLRGLAPSVRFLVNAEFVPGDAPLRHGDELAFVPPVAGG